MNHPLPPDMEAGPVAEIEHLLDHLVTEHGVAIPLAIESGSRAWGFPSPDSDYDCRFVYIRPAQQTFTLFPRRDVIEHPISDLIDVGGWELSKALRLLLRGNAVIIEWLTSPFAYRVDEAFRAAFLALAGEVADRNLIARHYFHLAEGQASRFLDRPEDVVLKKLLYVLRPLMALKWLTAHSRAAVAPMNFGILMQGVDLDDELRDEITRLLEQKRAAREIGTGPVPARIHRFVASTLVEMEPFRDAFPVSNVDANERVTDEFWRTWTKRLAPA